MRFITIMALSAIIILGSITSGALAQISDEKTYTGPVPQWIDLHEVDLDTIPSSNTTSSGGYHLLIDFQQNENRDERYIRQCLRIVNQDGISNYSDIAASYNPVFARLAFHHIRVYRDGAVIDKLHDHEIRHFQREQNLEFGLYDGYETAVINLRDIRVGDVLDYAYTITGSNPLLRDHVLASFNQQGEAPIFDLYLRVITSSQVTVEQHVDNGGEEFQVSNSVYGREYRWHGHDLQPLLLETNAPHWWYPEPGIALTSFLDWSEVVAWALPLYGLDPGVTDDLAALIGERFDQDATEESILNAIRFVQDEVRYLGREEGLGGLRPKQPTLSFEHRYGDCKDKSLLLVTLLGQMGVSAFPMLVSTALGDHVAEEPPSPLAFNHCVVGFDHAGKRYYVDPTLDHQGGGLDNLFFPHYGRGLPIQKGIENLVELGQPPVLKVEINEHFEVPAMGSGAVSYAIETTYHGLASDQRRSEFSSVSLDELGARYTRYYSASFPGIEQVMPIEVFDENRETQNTITIKEHYLIHEAWQPILDDSTMIFFEFYPLELYPYVDLAPSAARNAPYDPGPPIDFHITSTLNMPDEWPVDIKPIKINGQGYSFEHEVSTEGNLVVAEYAYRRSLRAVSADDTRAFLVAHNDILNQLGLSISDAAPVSLTREEIVGLIVFSIIGLAVLVGGAFLVKRSWSDDAEPTGPQVRPVVRYMARYMDMALFGMVSGFVLSFLIPGFEQLNDHLLNLVVVAVYVVVEPCMLSSWGTTPGKALLNVRLRTEEGKKLAYLAALRRAFHVWVRGMGLGIPIVVLITQLTSFSTLKENGSTSWDQRGITRVTHRSIGVGRIIAVVVFNLLMLMIILIGYFM